MVKGKIFSSRALEENSDAVEDTENDIHNHMVDDKNGEPSHALWVDRYAPRHFTELLSDDVSIPLNQLKMGMYLAHAYRLDEKDQHGA